MRADKTSFTCVDPHPASGAKYVFRSIFVHQIKGKQVTQVVLPVAHILHLSTICGAPM